MLHKQSLTYTHKIMSTDSYMCSHLVSHIVGYIQLIGMHVCIHKCAFLHTHSRAMRPLAWHSLHKGGNERSASQATVF